MKKLVKQKKINITDLTVEQKLDLVTQHLIKVQHKVDFFDTVTQTDGWMEMSEVAKLLNYEGYGRNNLMKFLRDTGVFRNRPGIRQIHNQPYQEYVDRGYFKLVEQNYVNGLGKTEVSNKPVCSQKGLEFIRRLLNDEINGQ